MVIFKFILKYIIFIILLLNVICLNGMSGNEKFKYFAFKESYPIVNSSMKRTKFIIDNLKDVKYGNINFINKNGKRPIFINKTSILSKETLGMAVPLFNVCFIFLNENYLKFTTMRDLRLLIIHEYLHCLYYPHILRKNDIMYSTFNKKTDINTLRFYLKDMKRRLNE